MLHVRTHNVPLTISSYMDVNTILAAGRADLCVMARAHLWDPYWTRRTGVAPTRWRGVINAKPPISQGLSDYSGGRTRTDDPRIMIPLL